MGRRKVRPEGMSEQEYSNQKSLTYAQNTRQGLYAFQGLYGTIFRQFAAKIADIIRKENPALLTQLNEYEALFQKVKDYGKHK